MGAMQKIEKVHIYNQLKQDVERRFGSKINYSKDCKLLAEQVFEKTNRQISISTIKRFFDIIKSSFQPSRYTLDTLAFFTGYENWDDYISHSQTASSSPSGLSVYENIGLITENSLNSISYKTKYDSRQFIPRLFARRFLESFLKSDKTATMLVAPKGYGKSSILLQWFTEYSNHSNINDYIVCLIDGGIFFAIYNLSESPAILNQLIDFDVKECPGIFLKNPQEDNKKKFIVIIDDIDEIFPRKDKYYNLVKNLMQIILLNKDNPDFKMILTCRPENLDPFTSLISQNPMLAKCWHHVSFFHQNHLETINIPSFNHKELKSPQAAMGNIRPYYFFSLYHPDLLQVISNPYYYSFLKNLTEVNGISEISFLDNLIHQAIYAPPYAAEKQSFVKSFLMLCNMAEEEDFVDKQMLLEETDCLLAYQELLASGILYEFIVTENSFRVQIKTRFSNKVIFEHILLRYLSQAKKPDVEFLQEIFLKYKNHPSLRSGALKWLVKLGFHEKNYDLLKEIHHLIENLAAPADYSYAATLSETTIAVQNAFTCCFRNDTTSAKTLLPWMAESSSGRSLYFNELFDLDNLRNFSPGILDSYLTNFPSPEGEVNASYIRFMKAFLNFDESTCQVEWERMKLIQHELINSPLSLAYYYSVLFLFPAYYYNENKPELIAGILATSAELRKKEIQQADTVPLFELTVLFNLNTCNLFDDILTLSEYIDSCYENPDTGTSGYWQYYKLCVARAHLNTGDEPQALELFRQVKFLQFPVYMRHFMQLQIDLSRAEFLIYMQKKTDASALLKDIHDLAGYLGYPLFSHQARRMEHKLTEKKTT